MPIGDIQKVKNEPVLIKVMKDGSKRYRNNACPKCGGIGYLHGYEHIDGARCWKCGATGYYPHEWTEPSEERIEKQKARNKKKLVDSAPQHNAEVLKNNGFNDEGKTYFVMGDTFKIKDELKAIGGKYNPLLGWMIPKDDERFDTVEVSSDEIFEEDENGWLVFVDRVELLDLLDRIKSEYEKNRKTNDDDVVSEYVGEVGQKITVDVTIDKISSFDTHYSYYGGVSYIYRFKDEEGNIYIWKTSNSIDKESGDSLVPMGEGDKLTITGTVKEHKEYKGEKETILTRCKVK